VFTISELGTTALVHTPLELAGIAVVVYEPQETSASVSIFVHDSLPIKATVFVVKAEGTMLVDEIDTFGSRYTLDETLKEYENVSFVVVDIIPTRMNWLIFSWVQVLIVRVYSGIGGGAVAVFAQ
jgi:hypothetical protein